MKKSTTTVNATKGSKSATINATKGSKSVTANKSQSSKKTATIEKETSKKSASKAKSTKQPSKKAEKSTKVYAGKAFKALVGDKAYSLEEAVELVKGDATLSNKVEEFAAAQSISYADAVKGLASKVGYEFKPSKKASAKSSKSAKQSSKKTESKTSTKAKSAKQPSKKAEKPTRIYAGKAFKALVGDKAYSLEEAVELVKGDATLGNKVEEFAAAQSISYADAVKGLAYKVRYEFKPSKKVSAKQSSKKTATSKKETSKKSEPKAKSTKQPSMKAEKPAKVYAGKAFKALVGDKAYSLEEAVELVKDDATLNVKVEEFVEAQSISYADAVKGLATKVRYDFKPSKKVSAKQSSKKTATSKKETSKKSEPKAKSTKQPSMKAEVDKTERNIVLMADTLRESFCRRIDEFVKFGTIEEECARLFKVELNQNLHEIFEKYRQGLLKEVLDEEQSSMKTEPKAATKKESSKKTEPKAATKKESSKKTEPKAATKKESSKKTEPKATTKKESSKKTEPKATTKKESSKKTEPKATTKKESSKKTFTIGDVDYAIYLYMIGEGTKDHQAREMSAGLTYDEKSMWISKMIRVCSTSENEVFSKYKLKQLIGMKDFVDDAIKSSKTSKSDSKPQIIHDLKDLKKVSAKLELSKEQLRSIAKYCASLASAMEIGDVDAMWKLYDEFTQQDLLIKFICDEYGLTEDAAHMTTSTGSYREYNRWAIDARNAAKSAK